MDTAAVTCPTCFETFEIVLPGVGETPCELDYDCEVCCRPMVIRCGEAPDGGSVVEEVSGLGD